MTNRSVKLDHFAVQRDPVFLHYCMYMNNIRFRKREYCCSRTRRASISFIFAHFSSRTCAVLHVSAFHPAVFLRLLFSLLPHTSSQPLSRFTNEATVAIHTRPEPSLRSPHESRDHCYTLSRNVVYFICLSPSPSPFDVYVSE